MSISERTPDRRVSSRPPVLNENRLLMLIAAGFLALHVLALIALATAHQSNVVSPPASSPLSFGD